MRSCMLLLTVDRSEYKVQQERIIADDLRSSLEIERSRNVELTSQLSRERSSQGKTLCQCRNTKQSSQQTYMYYTS